MAHSLMDDVRWMSAVQQARIVQEGLVSPEELRSLAIEVIERLDPLLGAVVIPLFDHPGTGVPMLLKDAGQEISGTPHWVGVAALRDAGNCSEHTTALVHRFERAGFSIIGKAACPSLSNGITTEPPGFGPTRNPWDLSRSAGGSSGGPAAAVAAGMVAVAHGSDATGSLRCPAALCGVATLNPTAGRIPSVPPAGQPANVAWRDFVLARHAEDLSAVFTALTGTEPMPSTTPLRVGLLDHDPELGLAVHPACAAGVHVAARLLERLGHRVDVSWPTALDSVWSVAAEAFGVVSDSVRPPVLEWVSRRLGRSVERGEIDDAVFEAAERSSTRSHGQIRRAQELMDELGVAIETWWHDFDLLITPTTFQPAWLLGGDPGPADAGTLMVPFSLSGQPALSLPLHQSDEGLPVGVQLVGRRHGDEMLLRVAQELQAAADWSACRPPNI